MSRRKRFLRWTSVFLVVIGLALVVRTALHSVHGTAAIDAGAEPHGGANAASPLRVSAPEDSATGASTREAATSDVAPEVGAPAPEAPSRELLVLDPAGAPISGAACSLAPSWSVVATTNGAGEARAKELVGPIELVIRASGWAVRRLQLPGGERSDEKVTVVLRPGGWIVGKVEGPLGSPVGAGVHVLALPPAAFQTAAHLDAARGGRGPLVATTTDERGEFAIGGLEVGVAHRLFAGAPGWIQADPFRPPAVARAEAEDFAPLEPFVTVPLKCAYGVEVVLQDAGRALRTSPRLRGPWAGTPRPVDARARVVPVELAAHLVLGAEPPAAHGSFHRRRFVFAADQDLGDALDLSFDVAVPGHAPVQASLVAARLSREFPVHVVPLARVTEGFGAIVVHTELTAPLADLVAQSSAGQPVLHLTDLVSGQRSSVDLDAPGSGVERIEGVPFGSYAAVFEAPGQLLRFPAEGDPPCVLEVGEADAPFHVPLASLGALVLDPCTPDGNLASGPIMVGLIRLRPDADADEGGESCVLLLRRRPYAVPYLPPGDYRVELLVPEGAPLARVEVVASRVTRVTARL
jgi:hypothetical protein